MFELLIFVFLYLIFSNVVSFIWGTVFGGKSKFVRIVKVPYRDFPHDEGYVQLCHGFNEVFIPTKLTPLHVWLNLDNYEGVQCCLGSVNTISSYNTQDGFVLIANITSEVAYVKWVAEFV